MISKIYRIHTSDNVAVAIEPISKGETVGEQLTAAEDIPAGHKIALKKIPAGADIVKYGFSIGTAVRDILPGQWVHTHCVATKLGGLLNYEYHPNGKPLKPIAPKTFMGYRRADGSVGIRNEVWIIPTVGCVSAIAKKIEEESQQFKTDALDGITAYSHPYGCSQLGDDQLNTQKALCGLIRHPNAGAVLVLGLGCENNNLDELKKVLGSWNPDRVKFMNCQDHEDEVEAALVLMRELCAYASSFTREECSASELIVGLKCGGSDGFSGITANPLVGSFSDRLIAQGGSTILTEVPEMFGAETILMNRCENEEVFHKTVDLINNFKSYFMRYGQEIDSNPSPGNKAGGITTLEDKSLGCVQKGGTALVRDVLRYGDPLQKKGLNLLQGPGNDLVAATATAVSGAHMVLFTTGRGTPFGCPVPTLKISSNTALKEKKSKWIDLDAGRLLSGASMEEVTDELFDLVLRVASGEAQAKSEALDKRDVAIFKDGVTL